MREANHYLALVRRRRITYDVAFQAVDDHKKERSCSLIGKKCCLDVFDDKIVAWDLECSGNETEGNIHKCYASGFAWKENDIFQYRSFWGLDVIPQTLDFLYENREKFRNHTFYAHNSGGYDLTFLFREGLLHDERFHIKKCIEQNGSYINLEILVGDGKNDLIAFHDSLKILPGSLEKLCKELDVEHQKLTETVSHDEITINNYHTFPALPKYLENDCKGLFEVIGKFSKDLFQSTIKPGLIGGENHVTQIFEQIYGKPFRKSRPKWLKFATTKRPLELDGYNEDLKIAFEYQGRQHMQRVPFFQKTQEDFDKQLDHDKLKVEGCLTQGVTLYVIPYMFPNQLPAYISDLLNKPCTNFKFNPGPSVGLPLSKCLTGASLSKKMFFNNYYKKMPTRSAA